MAGDENAPPVNHEEEKPHHEGEADPLEKPAVEESAVDKPPEDADVAEHENPSGPSPVKPETGVESSGE